MIEKVSIRNFKCLREVDIDLERFTVFVGPNASGKSSVLQAIDLLCRTFDAAEDIARREMSQSLSISAIEPLELMAQSGNKWYRYRYSAPSGQNLMKNGQHTWIGDGCGVASEEDTTDWKDWKQVSNGARPLPRTLVLKLETSNLVNPHANNGNPSAMASNGKGLHAALAHMMQNHPDTWQQLQADLREVIPTIKKLRYANTNLQNDPPALLFDTLGADGLRASQMSEGALLVLGLLASLHAPERPNLIFLDDLDRGLHPLAQKDLVSLLRGMLSKYSDLQICATTYSPYLLDCIEPNEVRITTLRNDGSTGCASLNANPEFERWKDEMSSGELWSLFGEKWLVEEGVPA